MQHLQNELRGTKRRLEQAQGGGGGGKGGKGKNNNGKGKGGKGVPAEFGNLSTKTQDGKSICFLYNLSGCSRQVRGNACEKGEHVCIKCASRDHGHANCPNR